MLQALPSVSQDGQVSIPTLLQHRPITEPKMWPSCGQGPTSISRCGILDNVSAPRQVSAEQPAHSIVCLMPVGFKQADTAVLEQSRRGAEQQPASITPPPSVWKQAKHAFPSEPLHCGLPSPSPSPFSENVGQKKDWPNKGDGIMADTLQDLKFLEELLSSNLDQGDMGNSEVHRTLLKSLFHLKKIMVLVPEVKSL